MNILLRKTCLAILFALAILFVKAQAPYRGVYIPTSFPLIGDGINPYQVSSSLQNVFLKKNIPTTFNKSGDVQELCNELQVSLEKQSSLLRSKVNVQLIDCRGNVVWENSGVGQSKEFVEGYAEAIEDALKNLNSLPINLLVSNRVVEKSDDAKSIFFNEKYIVELVEKEQIQELVVLNAEKLGYEPMQIIAKLTPSDLEGFYDVKFLSADGKEWTGMASLSNQQISISIACQDEKQKIILEKK